MSEVKPSGQSDSASGENQSKDSVSYDSHLKLLNEKKKAQQDFTETRLKLEEYEQAKLEAEGKLQEALDNAKKIASSEREKGIKIFKTASEKAIRSQFLRLADSLGCVDSDLAMKSCDFSSLELTEDFEFDPKQVEAQLQKLTKDKPYLFKKDFKLPPDVTPNGNSATGDMSLKDMKPDQLKQLLATKL
jgi:hypothetical protein